VAGTIIPRLTKMVINGYPLSSTKLQRGWDSDQYAIMQNRCAAYLFRSLYSLKNTMGIATPNHLRILYRSVVESQYSYALETQFDTSRKIAYQMDLTQLERYHLRSMAGLHPRAITCILFYDIQLLPLPLRAILLTIRYLRCALDTSPDQPTY